MTFVWPPDRVKTTTTTEGSGDIELQTVAAPGFRRPQDTVVDGDSTWWCIAQGNLWEVFEGVRVGNTLTRDVVISTSNSNLNRIDFNQGGVKEVFACIPGSKVGYTGIVGSYTAAQYFRARVGLGPNNNNWLQGNVDGVTGVHSMSAYVNNQLAHTFFNNSNVAQWIDSTSAVGPVFWAKRINNAPEAGSSGGGFGFQMADDAGVIRQTGLITSQWLNPSTSSGSARTNFIVYRSGVPITLATMDPDKGIIAYDRSVMAGRSTQFDYANAGCEMHPLGIVSATAVNAVPGVFGRNSSDGTIVSFLRDNALVGSISVAAGVVAYNTFHGAHYSRLGKSEPIGRPIEPGTVMVADEEFYDDRMAHLPKSIVSTKREDPAVYGVYCGLVDHQDKDENGQRFDSPRKPGDYNVSGIGIPPYGVFVVGPIKMGDILVTSDVRGCAEAWRWSWKRFWRFGPVQGAILGKALQSSPSSLRRRIRAALYCG